MVDLIKQYGPAILVLIISYYRDAQLAAQNKVKLAELEAKLLENQRLVDEKFAGKSDVDVIDTIIMRSGDS